MPSRDVFIEELLETLNGMILNIEEKEIENQDFSLVREIAEQLREEVEALQE